MLDTLRSVLTRPFGPLHDGEGVLALLKARRHGNPQSAVGLSRLQLLLVSGLLFFSAALGNYLSLRMAPLILMALSGAGVLLMCLRWPPLGLIAAVVAGMVVPIIGPSGLNASTLLVALLLGVWLLDMVARQRRISFVPSRTVWPLLGFLVVALLSFGVGQLPWLNFALHAPFGAQLGGLSIIVLSIGTFLLAANLITDGVWLRRLTWIFLVFAALSITLRSILPALGVPSRSLLQPMGSAFYIWLVSLAAGQAAFNRDLRLSWRLLLFAFVLVTLYILVVLKFADKSGWIPALLCLATIALLRSWRWGLLILLVGAVIVLYLARDGISSEAYSLSTRFDAWRIMLQLIKVNPIWGLGFANYYWYTPLYSIRGYAISFNSHNNYVDIVAQSGLVGLGFYLLFLFEMGRLGWRLRERVPAGFRQAYVYSVLGGLVGTVVVAMLGDWILPFFYNVGLAGFRTSLLTWLFLGGLVCLEFEALPQGPRQRVEQA